MLSGIPHRILCTGSSRNRNAGRRIADRADRARSSFRGQRRQTLEQKRALQLPALAAAVLAGQLDAKVQLVEGFLLHQVAGEVEGVLLVEALVAAAKGLQHRAVGRVHQLEVVGSGEQLGPLLHDLGPRCFPVWSISSRASFIDGRRPDISRSFFLTQVPWLQLMTVYLPGEEGGSGPFLIMLK